MRVFTLTPVPDGWTATIKGAARPVIALAVVEYTESGPPPYSKSEVMAMIVDGKNIVPANFQDGFEGLVPPPLHYPR